MYILENIESNFRVSRRIYPALYQDICQTFQRFLHSLDFGKIQALNLEIQANGGGLLPIENYPDATELMQVFYLFYYINGRLPFTTGLLPIPISIKKLYEQFCGSLSHGIVAVPFLCILNLFLSAYPEE